MTLHGRPEDITNGAGIVTGFVALSLGVSGCVGSCVGDSVTFVDDTGFVVQSLLFEATTGAIICAVRELGEEEEGIKRCDCANRCVLSLLVGGRSVHWEFRESADL